MTTAIFIIILLGFLYDIIVARAVAKELYRRYDDFERRVAYLETHAKYSLDLINKTADRVEEITIRAYHRGDE